MKPPFIVTGPPRSGTMITAQILANDYKCTVIDEFGFPPIPRSFEKVNAMIEKGITNIVIQSPAALMNPIEIFHTIPDLHWIGVVRKKTDIIKSMERIHYRQNDFYHWPDYLHDFVDHTRQLWGVAKSVLPDGCWTEIKYESLKEHPLFIPKEQREDFTMFQWKLNEPCGMPYWEDNIQCYLEKIGYAE